MVPAKALLAAPPWLLRFGCTASAAPLWLRRFGFAAVAVPLQLRLFGCAALAAPRRTAGTRFERVHTAFGLDDVRRWQVLAATIWCGCLLLRLLPVRQAAIEGGDSDRGTEESFSLRI